MKNNFGNTEESLKVPKSKNIKKALKILIFILIIDVALYTIFKYIFIYRDTTSYIFTLDFFNLVFTVLEVLFTLCFMTVILAGLECYARRSTQNLRTVEFLVALISLVVAGLQVSFYLMDPILGTMFLDFFILVSEWIFKNVVFFSLWIIIIIIIGVRIYLRNRGLKYKIFDYKVKSNRFLVFYDNKGNKKAFTILELASIPNNMRVREKRFRAQKVERLLVGKDRIYIHQHLTVLMTFLKETNFSYEISIHRDIVHVRLILSKEGRNEVALLKDMADKADVVERIFKFSFPGIEINHLGGTILKESFENIIMKFSDRKMKFLDDDTMELEQNIGSIYLKIFTIMGLPKIAADGEKTQIDELISLLINNRVNSISYYTSILPAEMLEFDTIRKANHRFFERKNTISDEELKNSILETRHSEATGLFKTSTFFVVRANNLKTLKRDCEKFKSIFSSIFVNNNEILTIKKKDIPFVLPYVISRNIHKNYQKMTSEHLAAYMHLPERPYQINKSLSPVFELPSEELFNEKIVLGDLLGGKETLYKLGIDIIDLSSNMLIIGSKNFPKSAFLSKLLIDVHKYYPKINIIIFDLNSEYKMLRDRMRDINYIDLGKESHYVDIFDPIGSAKEYARNLFAIIKDCYSKLKFLSENSKEVIRNILKKIITSPGKKTIGSFLQEFKNLPSELVNYKEIQQFLQVIKEFCKFNLNTIQDSGDSDKLKSVSSSFLDGVTLLDFGGLSIHDSKGVMCIFNILLKQLLYLLLQSEATYELKNLIVVGKADFIVPSTLREEPENEIGEDIPLLVKRVGTSMVCATENIKISRDFINNSSFKMLFKNDVSRKELINLFNLTREQADFIRQMPENIAILQTPQFSYPFPVKLPEYDIPKHGRDIYRELDNIEKNETFLDDGDDQDKIISKILESETLENPENLHFLDFKPVDPLEIEEMMQHDELRNTNNGKDNELIEKVKQIIATSPVEPRKLQEKLAVEKKECDQIIKELKEKNLGGIAKFPQYYNDSLTEKIFLGDETLILKNQIREKCDFILLDKGTFKKGANGLDYISKSGKIGIKILARGFHGFNKAEITQKIADMFIQLADHPIEKLVIVTSFIKQRNMMKTWSKEWKFMELDVYSFQKNDFSKLISKYLLKN